MSTQSLTEKLEGISERGCDLGDENGYYAQAIMDAIAIVRQHSECIQTPRVSSKPAGDADVRSSIGSVRYQIEPIAALPQDRVEAVARAIKPYATGGMASEGATLISQKAASAAIAADEAWRKAHDTCSITSASLQRHQDIFEMGVAHARSAPARDGEIRGHLLAPTAGENPAAPATYAGAQISATRRSCEAAGDASAETVEIRPPAPVPLSPEMREKVTKTVAMALWNWEHEGRQSQVLDIEWQLLQSDYLKRADTALAALEPYVTAWRAGE
jgi:hypothetical protein